MAIKWLISFSYRPLYWWVLKISSRSVKNEWEKPSKKYIQKTHTKNDAKKWRKNREKIRRKIDRKNDKKIEKISFNEKLDYIKEKCDFHTLQKWHKNPPTKKLLVFSNLYLYYFLRKKLPQNEVKIFQI